jgi:hypothetical protein
MLAAGLRAFWLRVAHAPCACNRNRAVDPGRPALAPGCGRASARGLRALCVVWACLIFLSPDRAVAQASPRLAEPDITAGMLYNFLRYTDWPATAEREVPINVCLYGGDPFEGRLASMAGRTVNQRVIAIRTVRTNADLDACALVFVNARERAAWPRLRAELSRRSVLTVSDYEGFARAGGMLEFTRVRNRVGVAVNVEAASAANLRVQDRLLRLATIVASEER